MTAVQNHELAPGLCFFLDIATLAHRADTLRSPFVDHKGLTTKSVRMPFLLLDYVPKRSSCLCIPLFDNDDEPGQEPLDDSLKERGLLGWQMRSSFITPRDGWLIPVPSLKAASECEVCTVENRMRYARRNLKELHRLRQVCVDLNAEFVPVWDTPTFLPRMHPSMARSRVGFQTSVTWAA
jgi:hypothetical protein